MRMAILILVCTAMNIAYSYSQNHFCGVMPGDEDNSRLRRNIAAAREIAIDRNDFIYIPMHFIITTDEKGLGAIKEHKILDALCKLNVLCNPLGFQFYIDGPVDYLASDAIYDQSTSTHSQQSDIYNLNKKEGTINVFIGGALPYNSSAYYSSSTDVIYMNKRYVNSSYVVLAHEIGHFFSLRHTFYGWENRDYNPDEPTPHFIPNHNSIVFVEFVDRDVNCESAADLLCGTPADYITDWNGPCNYTGGAIDPDGVPIDPDESNIMGYYNYADCIDYIFSLDQMETMMMDYTFRSDINSLIEPNLELVTEAPVGLFPIDEEVVDGSCPVQLSWASAENASLYAVEFSSTAQFSFVTSTHIVDKPTFSFEDVELDDEYFWRVKAINKTDLCGDWTISDVYKFKTKDLINIKSNPWIKVKVYPNPTSGVIYIKGITLSDKQVTMTDILGNIIPINVNNYINKINLHQPIAGTYLLSIKSDSSAMTSKVVVELP